MGTFNFHSLSIKGLFVIEPQVFTDARGYFMETYRYSAYAEAGIDTVFVQDNQSHSQKGVLRGLHYQKTKPQAKLVRVLSGEVFDVAVDIRKKSPTYGQWEGVYLTAENKKQFYIPRGFAHGYLVLSDEATFAYKCDGYYDPSDEGGILWNDLSIKVSWPVERSGNVALSEKDRQWPELGEISQDESI